MICSTPACRKKECLNKEQHTQKCYAFIYGKEEPCAYCVLKDDDCPEKVNEITFEENDHFYVTKWEKRIGTVFRLMSSSCGTLPKKC